MLADKDPVALELYARHGNVVMPNFNLSDVEVEALIEYLGAESQRVQRTASAAAPVRGKGD